MIVDRREFPFGHSPQEEHAMVINFHISFVNIRFCYYSVVNEPKLANHQLRRPCFKV